MACLDSDILVGFLRSDKKATEFIESLEKQKEPLKTTIITLCELYEGANLFHDRERATKATEGLLSKMTVLELTKNAAQLFGKVTVNLNTQGKKLEDFDVLIACIALENNETLVTRNTKHFERIPDLKIREW